MKLAAHRAWLPGEEWSFLIVPLDPAYEAGLAGHIAGREEQVTVCVHHGGTEDTETRRLDFFDLMESFPSDQNPQPSPTKHSSVMVEPTGRMNHPLVLYTLGRVSTFCSNRYLPIGTKTDYLTFPGISP